MRNLPHVIAVGGSVAATPSSVFGSFWRFWPMDTMGQIKLCFDVELLKNRIATTGKAPKA